MKTEEDEVDQFIARRLREIRRERRLSLVSVAEAVGVSYQQIQRYERGENSIRAGTLVRLADALDVHIAALVPFHASISERCSKCFKKAT